MKNIVIISPPLISIPTLYGGAIEKYVYNLGMMLSKSGYKINIITIKDQVHKYKQNFINNSFKITRISVPKIFFIKGVIYNFKVFIKLFKSMNTDLIFFNDVSQVFIPLMLKVFNRNLLSIFTIHNVRPWFKTKNHTKIRNIIDFILGILSLKNANKIINFTNSMKNYIISRFYINKNKISIVPHGISKEIVEKYPIKLIKNNSSLFKIIFIGRIVKDKGLEFLIEALARLRNEMPQNFQIFLHIIGPTRGLFGNFLNENNKESKYLRKIERLINKFHLNNNILFEGELKASKIFDFLYNSDVYISPTLGETFSLSALESLSVGIPVIITNYAGITEYLENNKNCLIIPRKNVDAIVEAIKKILFNLDLQINLVKNGKKTILKRFIWEIIIKKYNKIIKKLKK